MFNLEGRSKKIVYCKNCHEGLSLIITVITRHGTDRRTTNNRWVAVGSGGSSEIKIGLRKLFSLFV